MYQPARDMLSEAYNAAVTFKDTPLAARVLFLLARLSVHEAQYGQAINVCLQAQVYSVQSSALVNNSLEDSVSVSA